jgi:hypothetical protein
VSNRIHNRIEWVMDEMIVSSKVSNILLFWKSEDRKQNQANQIIPQC